MFCSSCGSPNPDTASFCNKCGAPLSHTASAPAPAQVPQMGPTSAPMPATQRKEPVLAAILNLFFGIGYLYLGFKKVLSITTILFVILVLIVDIILGLFTFGLVPIVVAIILAYDGYLKAKGEKGYIGTEPALLYQP